MRKALTTIAVVMLLVTLGSCRLFDPDDHEPRWVNYEEYFFPVYLGDFGDYVRSDSSGANLGLHEYGQGGDGLDWSIMAYDPQKINSLPISDLVSQERSGTKDAYQIEVKAIDVYSLNPIPALIIRDGVPTGDYCPHTYTFQGEYDQLLEDSFDVNLPYAQFAPDPVVQHDPLTNTYTYIFWGSAELPPYLEDFNASLNEDGKVELTWTTFSETSMQGFWIYRSEGNDIVEAVRVNSTIIPATNTSEQHFYTYTDDSVLPKHSYYYWFERSFQDQTSWFYGPVFINVPANVDWISYAYPNPCTERFTLPIDVKPGADAILLMIDSEKHIRKSVSMEEGSQMLNVDVSDLEAGFYRVFVWYSDGYYSYGDVLVRD